MVGGWTCGVTKAVVDYSSGEPTDEQREGVPHHLPAPHRPRRRRRPVERFGGGRRGAQQTVLRVGFAVVGRRGQPGAAPREDEVGRQRRAARRGGAAQDTLGLVASVDREEVARGLRRLPEQNSATLSW
eukprot:SAG11_NODE_1318_length_5212_cov_3.462351_7_plen_129_part_00